jgi:hypothetical protein
MENEERHLADTAKREDVADLLPFAYPSWYDSLGIDQASHWALVRPLLKTPSFRQPEAEIDIILGPMKAVLDSHGNARPVWPHPRTIWWQSKQSAHSSKGRTPSPGEMQQKRQLERNLDLGFHRVSALHVVATQPSDDYWGMMRVGQALGKYYLPIANGHLLDLIGDLPVGHAVLTMASIKGKHEGLSGGLAPMKMNPAPLSGAGLKEFARMQIERFLAACPPPSSFRAVYIRSGRDWRSLPTIS